MIFRLFFSLNISFLDLLQFLFLFNFSSLFLTGLIVFDRVADLDFNQTGSKKKMGQIDLLHPSGSGCNILKIQPLIFSHIMYFNSINGQKKAIRRTLVNIYKKKFDKYSFYMNFVYRILKPKMFQKLIKIPKPDVNRIQKWPKFGSGSAALALAYLLCHAQKTT